MPDGERSRAHARVHGRNRERNPRDGREHASRTRFRDGGGSDARRRTTPRPLVRVRSRVHSRREPHSLKGQVVTCAWTMRHEAHRRRRAGQILRAPDEIVVGVAVGSKMFPRRVNTFLVALPPGGAAFRFFVAFALAWEDGAECTPSPPTSPSVSRRRRRDAPSRARYSTPSRPRRRGRPTRTLQTGRRELAARTSPGEGPWKTTPWNTFRGSETTS